LLRGASGSAPHYSLFFITTLGDVSRPLSLLLETPHMTSGCALGGNNDGGAAQTKCADAGYLLVRRRKKR